VLGQAFASLGFPGLTGVITGVSAQGIALSEKVWEVSNASVGIQRGRYDGEADVLVMRDVLELAADRQTAEVRPPRDPRPGPTCPRHDFLYLLKSLHGVKQLFVLRLPKEHLCFL
jgi:hypothetical protein